MALTILRESLTRGVIEELKTLLPDHASEVGRDAESVNHIDWMLYQYLDEHNLFYLYTARDGFDLVGYLGYMVSPSAQDRDDTRALCDCVYVSPKYRGMTLSKMLRYSEGDLRDNNVKVIIQPVSPEHDFSPILKRNGFGLTEYYYSKRI